MAQVGYWMEYWDQCHEYAMAEALPSNAPTMPSQCLHIALTMPPPYPPVALKTPSRFHHQALPQDALTMRVQYPDDAPPDVIPMMLCLMPHALIPAPHASSPSSRHHRPHTTLRSNASAS